MRMTFEQWYVKVDKAIQSLCGMSRDDLPDCCYADWYEQGISPSRAARKAIRDAF